MSAFAETASGSSCILREPVEYFRQLLHLTLLNHIVEKCDNVIENGDFSNTAVFDVLVHGGSV
ncbi:hypothetical protein T03_821 [Trichinella britovi]|uniref:Uncharacterized protein n=1 Tax=Trichinella britovi TaxID=45882 RepID=A0A0V0YZ42_TRIBR|nr:hypothetical protein T03_821 [Trichinella britovi]